MKLHIICVAYERVIPLEILVRSFMVQTNPNWVLHVVYDGPTPPEILNIKVPFKDDKRVRFYESEERYGCYGHPNRRSMLQTIETEKGDFVLLTNDDNYYVPVFVEYMLGIVKKKTGIVMCNTVHSHAGYDINFSELRENSIDIGAFIVREDIAKTTGFNHDHFSADGTYAEECHRNCLKFGSIAVKINKALFIHN